MDVHGFVTAGGRSSRMGRDKAWLELDGRPMIQRVIEQLLLVVPSVTVIANDPEYDRLGLPVVADRNQAVGPLEAIRVALASSLAPSVLLVACDLPFRDCGAFWVPARPGGGQPGYSTLQFRRTTGTALCGLLDRGA
jgi:molybdopterin-guanine dinucleotide biosynthesis protein A